MDFFLHTDESKKYQWYLKDTKGVVIAKSINGYNTEKEAIDAIDQMVKNKNQYRGLSELKPDATDSNKEKWFWTLKHKETVVAKSVQGFNNKAESQKSIGALMHITNYKVSTH